MDERQSRLIAAMRFPLIVLVVFAHSAGVFESPTIAWSLDGWNVFHFVSEWLCRHVCSVGTCWFFVISGFFFFLKADPSGFSWIPLKWKKRVRSLLIPYVIWNAWAVLAVFLVVHLFPLAGIPHDNTDWEFLRNGGPWYWFVSGPADFPLWFVRDLMVMILLAPLLVMLFRRIPFVSLTVLSVFYLCYPFDLPFVSMRGCYFFSVGAWFGIQGKNMLSFCRRWETLSWIVAPVLAVVATLRTGYDDHYVWLRLFYPFGMVVFMNLCHRLTEGHPERESRLIKLSASVFFIYAAHEIFILGWTKGLFVRLFGEGLAGSWIRLLLAPVLAIVICLGLYNLLNRCMPRLLAFCTGGRTSVGKTQKGS